MVNWNGRWEGGRTALSRGKVVYYIERSMGGREHRKKIARCLGAVSHDQALAELSRCNDDPLTYLTPEERKEAIRQDADDERRAQEAAAVIINEATIDEFVADLSIGYGSGKHAKPAHPEYVYQVKLYCRKWIGLGENRADTTPFGSLKNRDLRGVTKAELEAGLRPLPKGSRKNWTVALRSIASWLRFKERLVGDSIAKISVPQWGAKDAKKIEWYEVSHIVRAYAAIPNQCVRDIVRIRVSTGLHVSEIERLVIDPKWEPEPVEGGEIAGVVSVRHKSGHVHRQSVGADVLAAFGRLRDAMKHGYKIDNSDQVYFGFPTKKTQRRNMAIAARVSKTPPIKIGNLRHSYITLGQKAGARLAEPPKGVGVGIDVIAQLVGHRDRRTTATFYTGALVPPMLVLPIKLQHQNDPNPAKRKKAA